MDCECAFAESVQLKSHAAKPVASPVHETGFAFRSAAGNLAVQRQAQETAAQADGPSSLSPVAQHGPATAGQPPSSGTRESSEPHFRQDSRHDRIQAKLTVNAPGDAFEQEADHVAEQVMDIPGSRTPVAPVSGAASGVQRQAAGAPDPPPEAKTEVACVKVNLEEENRLSHLSPGKIDYGKGPAPTPLSLYDYGNDEAFPKPVHLHRLITLAPLLARHHIPVILVGHASCPGKALHNWTLSKQRAEIAASFLKGVPIVAAIPFGESHPVADNSTVEGRSRNRAVDIIPLWVPPRPKPICEIFPALCRRPSICELFPALCGPSICQIFPVLCQQDHRKRCEKDPEACRERGLCDWLPALCDDDGIHLPSCLDHPVICVCLLAPEFCLACIEDPALCVGIAKCLVNPASCVSPPGPKPKPPAPVSVTFTPVRASNTPAGAHDRIPDTGSTAVAAIVTGWRPSMPPIRISADSAGGENGDVLINGANEIFITTSAIIQVQGVSQTSPNAPDLPLSLHATMDPTPVGQSAPFAVADFMENMSIDLQDIVMTDPSLLSRLQVGLMGANVVQNSSRIGMAVSMDWDSDGARGKDSLNQVSFNWAHQVLVSTGKWTSRPLGGVLGKGNKGYTFEALEDMPMHDVGRRETQLVWFLADGRSHSVAAITNSGFKLVEVVEPDPHRQGCLQLVTSMTGNAGDIQGFRSNAGSGVATATIPLDCRRECGTPQLPDSAIPIFTGTDRGESVRVRPLTRCGPPGTSPRKGTLPAFNCIPSNERNNWARAHLLNENLHGLGINPNLIIADRFINNQMPPRFENPLKDRILLQDQVFDYFAVVDHEAQTGDRRYFARRISVAAQQIDPVTGTSIGSTLEDDFDRVRDIPLTCT